MAAGNLKQADLLLAFDFARSVAAPVRDGDGVVSDAPINAPRFDHDETGTPLGLLVTAGADFGQRDRLTLDPLILPEDLATSDESMERECTVLHVFTPEGASDPTYRAWYSRAAQRTIDSLIQQIGHHRSIGVLDGFRENRGGIVRYRQRDWQLANPLAVGSNALPVRVLSDGSGMPVITAGAEMVQ